MEGGYWVSKKSLRCFKQLAMQKYETEDKRENGVIKNSNNNNNENDNNNNDNNNDIMSMEVTNGIGDVPMEINQSCASDVSGSGAESSMDTSTLSATTSALSVDEPATIDTRRTFQDDIVCDEHNNLSINENTRKVVTPEVWERCMKYFPEARSFTKDTSPVCEMCARAFRDTLEEKRERKQLANEQKKALFFLNSDPEQRTEEIVNGDTDCVYHLLLTKFVAWWRRTVRLGGDLTALSVDNEDVMCEHDKLLYDAEELIDYSTGPEAQVFLVTEEEFAAVRTYYNVENDVILKRVKNEGGGENRYEIIPGELLSSYISYLRRHKCEGPICDRGTL